MISVITDNIDKIAIFISGVITSFFLAFVSPFATQWMTRRFARKPAFSVSTERLGTELLLEIRPLNALASKKRNLNIRLDNVNLPTVANIRYYESGFGWIVDLNPPHIRGIFMQNEQCGMSFFFDAELASESVVVRRPIEPFDDKIKKVARTSNFQELLYAIDSNTKVYAFLVTATSASNFRSGQILSIGKAQSMARK